MSRPIQAFAPGFLSPRGLKNNGQLPPEMIDAVAPIIDITPWYLEGLREVIPFGTAVNVQAIASYSLGFQVPAGEMWWVHSAVVQWGPGAGTTITGQVAHFNRSIVPIHLGPILAMGGAAASAPEQQIGEFFAQSGDFFGCITNVAAGVATNAVMALTISRFLI